MNFDEMVELINNMKKTTNDDECMICHLPIENNITKLKCMHKYHSECIEYLKKNQSIICPYCQVLTNISNNIKKENHINLLHCNKLIKSGPNKGNQCYKTNCMRHNKVIKTICSTILKTGTKKGLVCGRSNCKIHSKLILNV